MARIFRARTTARLALAALVALIIVAPQPAGADPLTGTAVGQSEAGYAMHLGSELVGTDLIRVKLADGSPVDTYCVELETTLARNHPMVESDWDAFPGPSQAGQHGAQISWIAANAYPAITVGTLEDAVAAGGATFHDGLSSAEALSAAQSAIWHFSDAVEPARDDPSSGDESVDEDILATYDYLVANAGSAPEPPPALDVQESTATGAAGKPVGPFHVRTTASGIGVGLDDLPAGTEVTDADGTVVDPATLGDGSAFYVRVPGGTAPGDGDVVVSASAPLAAGRPMFATDYESAPSQSLVVATSPAVAVSETVHVSWTPSQVTAGDVTLDGYPVVGEVLTAETSGWEPDDVSFGYQWLRDGDPVDGADGSTYTLGADDDGHTISVHVVGSATGHDDAERTSDDVAVTSGELTLSDDSVKPGQTLTVTGTGFAPDASYAMELRSDPVDLGQVSTDGTGAFSADVTVPEGFDAGAHRIVVTAESGVEAASVQLEVHAASSTPSLPIPDRVLPDTGGGALGALAAAIVLLVAGLRMRKRLPW